MIGHDISLGEVVSPSAEQFIVADISRMWILLDVRREDAANLLLGQEVVFTTDGGRTDIHSTISWISTEVDEKTRTVSVRAEVDNPLISDDQGRDHERRRLLANAFGTGAFACGRCPTPRSCPTTRCNGKGAAGWCSSRWTIRPSGAPVELGITRRNVVEVLSGLEPGVKIATTGSHLLKSEVVRSRLAARH